mmetsp:Transcript_13806/g.25888  ORF Transcript_13806/g.25888 Transcript_13806/m.25888 type:complete len:223 (+) Transcript_13806:345-1013(+)
MVWKSVTVMMPTKTNVAKREAITTNHLSKTGNTNRRRRNIVTGATSRGIDLTHSHRDLLFLPPRRLIQGFIGKRGKRSICGTAMISTTIMTKKTIVIADRSERIGTRKTNIVIAVRGTRIGVTAVDTTVEMMIERTIARGGDEQVGNGMILRAGKIEVVEAAKDIVKDIEVMAATAVITRTMIVTEATDILERETPIETTDMNGLIAMVAEIVAGVIVEAGA